MQTTPDVLLLWMHVAHLSVEYHIGTQLAQAAMPVDAASCSDGLQQEAHTWQLLPGH
jgi:hypothetical protein